jgi:hypothetical protein
MLAAVGRHDQVAQLRLERFPPRARLRRGGRSCRLDVEIGGYVLTDAPSSRCRYPARRRDPGALLRRVRQAHSLVSRLHRWRFCGWGARLVAMDLRRAAHGRGARRRQVAAGSSSPQLNFSRPLCPHQAGESSQASTCSIDANVATNWGERPRASRIENVPYPIACGSRTRDFSRRRPRRSRARRARCSRVRISVSGTLASVSGRDAGTEARVCYSDPCDPSFRVEAHPAGKLPSRSADRVLTPPWLTVSNRTPASTTPGVRKKADWAAGRLCLVGQLRVADHPTTKTRIGLKGNAVGRDPSRADRVYPLPARRHPAATLVQASSGVC